MLVCWTVLVVRLRSEASEASRRRMQFESLIGVIDL
jgi:hypothetical protein